MAKTTIAPISDETKEMIEDHVKKGKARKFFMVCKGVTINTLEVFKKGPFGPRIMKAKGEGFKGEVTYGVVTGSGKELYFQLAGNQAVAESMKVDSFFDKPPTKRAKLREFLAENDLAFKPSYYIITDPAFAPDPDAESGSLPAKPPANAEVGEEGIDDAAESVETESESETATAPVSETSQFTERLKALKPDIDKVVAAGLPVSAEVKLKVSEAAMFARKKEYDQANSLLDLVENLLQQGASTAGEAESAETESEEVNLSGDFNKRLAAVVAQLKEATGNLQAGAAKLKISEAGVFARKKEFGQANGLLDEAESLLEGSAPGGASAMEQWKAARSEVVKTLQKLGQAIVASGFPDAKGAIILIKAIAANLTETPDTLQKINELERYLVTDDIIEEAEEPNGFGFEVNIREPLMTVLEDLKKEVPA